MQYTNGRGEIMRKGYGNFFNDVEAKEPKNCNVCNAKMQSKQYYGATSWAGALGGEKRQCYQYTCPHINEKWHELAVDIMTEEEHTKSPTLKGILHQDVSNIVQEGLFGINCICSKNKKRVRKMV